MKQQKIIIDNKYHQFYETNANDTPSYQNSPPSCIHPFPPHSSPSSFLHYVCIAFPSCDCTSNGRIRPEKQTNFKLKKT